PARISACARSREDARPRSNKSLSSRTFILGMAAFSWKRGMAHLYQTEVVIVAHIDVCKLLFVQQSSHCQEILSGLSTNFSSNLRKSSSKSAAGATYSECSLACG